MLSLSQIRLIVLAVSVLIAFGTGWQVCSWKQDAKEKKALEDKIELQKAYDTLSREIVKKYNETDAKTTVIYRTIKKDVKNVTDNRICFADSNALKLWNNALSGMLDPATGTSETPSGADSTSAEAAVTDREVIENGIENFEQYKRVRDQLNALIDFYEQSSK